MVAANKNIAIAETLKWEGGYSNNPSDPGGPTNWGITIADARKYWKKDASAADVKLMPKSVAIDIYASKYWKTPQYDCDKLESGVDLAVFDFGVNSGPARAKKYLLESVGGSAEETVIKLCDKRLAFLKGLQTWPVFGKGWVRRVAGIKSKALALAKNKTAPIIGKKSGLLVLLAGLGATITTWWDNFIKMIDNNPTAVMWVCLALGIIISISTYLKFRKK